MTDKTRRMDHSVLRTNQAFIIGLLVLAFILNLWPLVAFVSAVMLVGTIWPSASLFKRVYRHLLKPSGIVKPDVIPDNPESHRFAQGLGSVFTLAASLSLIMGVTTLGWALSWIVVALAALNLSAGFCAGCFVYYRLNRLGVPGFVRSPLEGESSP